MNMQKSLAVALVSMGLATWGAVPIMAQTNTPAATAGAQAQHGERHQHERLAHTERVEARLARIRTALKITDAQQPQWNAYAETVRRQAAARDQQRQSRRDTMTQGKERVRQTAVERLERQQQMHVTAAAQINERLAVQKPLYAVLTEEQRKVADRALASRGKHGGGRREMHRTADAGSTES